MLITFGLFNYTAILYLKSTIQVLTAKHFLVVIFAKKKC